MKIVCGNCGKVFAKIVVNGYEYGDRLLEDVMFDVFIENDELVVKIQPECESYFIQFNAEYWYKEIKDGLMEGYECCEDCDGILEVIK